MTEREDIELALIRILATDGLVFGGVSAEDKRERIRVAIMQRGLRDKPFNAHLTFGEAFWQCYRRQVEMRRTQREDASQPGPIVRSGPGDDDEDDGSEDEG